MGHQYPRPALIVGRVTVTGLRSAGRIVAAGLVAAGLGIAVPLIVAGPVMADTTTPDIPPLAKDGCTTGAATRSTQLSWAQKRLDTKQVWQLTRGAGVTVAVIDSGVDKTHPQLAGRVKPGADLVGTSGSGDTDPCTGHGTFVAGIIAAAPVDGTPFAGIAPEVTIVPYRQSEGTGGGKADTLGNAIHKAVDDGANVINVSVATNDSTANLAGAVAYAESHNVLIVASVANEAASGNPVTYPSGYPTVLGVGAVDQNGKRAQFSEVGDFVDLVGPGVDVVSTGPRGVGHVYASGTSFAAPYVTGTAALVRAYHRNLTAAQVRHRLQVTADHPAKDLPDPEYGWGVVNPYAAVASVLPEELGATKAQPSPVFVPAVAPHRAYTSAQATALAVAGVALVLTVVGLLSRPMLTRGRRRRWAPAERRQADQAGPAGTQADQMPAVDGQQAHRASPAGAQADPGAHQPARIVPAGEVAAP